MDTIDQIRVARTSRISIAANILLCRVNCRGEKAKLKIRLRINGRTTIKATSFFAPIKNTFPNDTAISIYKNVQTGPNSQDGGAHEGLISCVYQV